MANRFSIGRLLFALNMDRIMNPKRNRSDLPAKEPVVGIAPAELRRPLLKGRKGKGTRRSRKQG